MRHPPPPREAAPRTHAPSSPSRSSDQAALVYLKREVLPELERSHYEAAARGVERALHEGTLAPLVTLSATQKHELLGSLEARLSRRASRARPGPSVIVRLTSCLDLTPPELLELERRRPILPSR